MKTRITTHLLPLLLALCLPVFANAAAESKTVTVLKAAHLLDVKTGKLVANPQILIEDERITAIGNTINVPDNAEIVDLGDYILLPGFIDAHVHLAGGGGLNAGVARGALRGAYNAKLTLNTGFTTVRSMGGAAFSGIALRNAINDGDIPGPRLFDGGAMLSVTGGHCSGQPSSPDNITESRYSANSPDEFRHKTREIFKYGADFVKICITGGFVSGTDPTSVQFTEEEVRAVIETAHALGKKVAVHAYAPEGVKIALNAGADSIEHGSLLDDENIKLFKKSPHSVLVPTLAVFGTALERAERVGITPLTRERLTHVLSVYKDNIRKAVRAGIPIIYGTDGPAGNNTSEFPLLVEVGLSPLEVIRSATLHAAKFLDAEKDIGSIEVGKYADIVAVKADPTQNIDVLSYIPWVMKGGVIYKDKRGEEKPVARLPANTKDRLASAN